MSTLPKPYAWWLRTEHNHQAPDLITLTRDGQLRGFWWSKQVRAQTLTEADMNSYGFYKCVCDPLEAEPDGDCSHPVCTREATEQP